MAAGGEVIEPEAAVAVGGGEAAQSGQRDPHAGDRMAIAVGDHTAASVRLGLVHAGPGQAGAHSLRAHLAGRASTSVPGSQETLTT